MHELRHLGPEFRATHDVAKQLELFKCGHDEQPLSPADCILAHIGDKCFRLAPGPPTSSLISNRIPAGTRNPEHLWVATQDRELRGALQGLPGCPSLFLTVNGAMLEDPSEAQEAVAREKEEGRMHASEREKSTVLKDIAPTVRTSALHPPVGPFMTC